MEGRTLKLKLVIAYHGGHFSGWQTQATGQAVQPLIEAAWRALIPGKHNVHGASRTDAGVHAMGMVAHVELPRDLFKLSMRKVPLALNARLPDHVRVVSAHRVPSTFHARYQQSHDIAALLDLLVMDRDNPRSLCWVAQTLRGRLARLAGSAPGELSTLSLSVPNPDVWDLEEFCRTETEQHQHLHLVDLLQTCTKSAYTESDEISVVYFTHSGESKQSLGV